MYPNEINFFTLYLETNENNIYYPFKRLGMMMTCSYEPDFECIRKNIEFWQF